MASGYRSVQYRCRTFPSSRKVLSDSDALAWSLATSPLLTGLHHHWPTFCSSPTSSSFSSEDFCTDWLLSIWTFLPIDLHMTALCQLQCHCLKKTFPFHPNESLPIVLSSKYLWLSKNIFYMDCLFVYCLYLHLGMLFPQRQEPWHSSVGGGFKLEEVKFLFLWIREQEVSTGVFLGRRKEWIKDYTSWSLFSLKNKRQGCLPNVSLLGIK